MGKAGRSWIALDTNFVRDDKVLAAGERAGWLFLAILGAVRATGRDGVISRAQVGALGVPVWQPRLATLLRVGLLVEVRAGEYAVPAWDEWQTPPSRAEYMRKWRARRRAEQGDDGRQG